MALRWFRFGKQQEEDAAQESAAPEEEAPPEALQVEQEATEPTDEQSSSTGPKKRRRRGSRGGKGRKKPVTATANDSDVDSDDASEGSVAVAAKAPATRSRQASKPDAKPDRKQSRSGNRRRTPTKRAPLPAAKRELVISVDVGEQRVAILEDDRVAEVYLERPERRSIAGNIYLGVVDNVLPGMEAAFVEIGLEKNGFLYVDEIVGPELEGRKGARKIQDLIKRGQTIMVQAVKDPMKSKGARLTTEISLPGRFLVYVPNGEGSGVSRRLEDAERTRLKDIVKRLDPKGGGIIVRTAAEGASAEDIERDLVFLQRLWKTVQTKAKSETAPSLVYEEAELPLRIVRDLFAGDFLGARIDDDRTHRRIVSYLKKTSPHMVERVHRYRDKEPLFDASGVDAEIRSTLQRRVDLPSGGYLVFDYAEAFTVIDVNTGRFVGSRGKSAQGRLEDTIVKNNLEAVKEVVRQLRLRDIGGIIVIDFIDMANPKNRETVEEALRSELERDRTKTYVVEISPLGLVEMTRQNVTDGPREILTARCHVCEGAGVVVSDATHALEIERKLRAIAKGSRVQAFKVAVHPRVLALLVGPGGRRLTALDAASRRRFFLVPAAGNGHVHLDHFEVIAQGKLETTRPSAPLEEGSSVELKLVEVGLHDPTAAVGKVDGGYEVVVAGAAKLVGKKVTATIGSVLESAAYATLADDVVADSTPITFEAEAEKPMRASRSKKEPLPAEAPVENATAEAEIEDEIEVGGEPTEVSDDALEGEVKVSADGTTKKRTRRGTRGGRNRKKPAAASTASGGELDSAAGADNGRLAPRIHVPPADLATPGKAPPTEEAAQPAKEASPTEDTEPTEERVGAEGEEADGAGMDADGQPKRKRSRRGSRGGKKRRKPAAEGGVNAVPAEGDVAVEVTVEVVSDGDAPAYVPMSEWIDDFDSRSRT
ncbi:MAG: Rne/Rng family ribonuclease [Gaiellaceae bacterium]